MKKVKDVLVSADNSIKLTNGFLCQALVALNKKLDEMDEQVPPDNRHDYEVFIADYEDLEKTIVIMQSVKSMAENVESMIKVVKDGRWKGVKVE